MWIRSQDKEKLIQCNYIFIGIRDNYFCIYQYKPNSYASVNLGEYSTKEKAMKVLDKMQYYIKGGRDENGCIVNVIQMPQDEEVE